MRMHLHCLCWNEARIIPWFLRHYLPLFDRVFVYDNGSSDRSVALLSGDERISIATFDVTGDSFVDEERRLSDAMWKSSRDEADWVAVVDMDEHIAHPDLRSHLAACKRAGITAIQAVGYEMVSDDFPPANARLSETITNGFRNHAAMNKFCLFDPNAIKMSNFHPGRHNASPEGHVIWDNSHTVKLLHYKQPGLDYFAECTAELRTGLRPGDIANGWGAHYERDAQRLRRDFERHLSLARPVPGLQPSEADHEIHLVVGGERIPPIAVDDNRFHFPLPSGSTAVRIVSRCASPVVPRLGVSVESLTLSQGERRLEIPLDSPGLCDGWWGLAREEDGFTRWTDGNALLVMSSSIGACILEVRLTHQSLALVR